MANNSLRQAFNNLDLSKKDKDQLIPALLGFMIQGRETVEVPARPGFVYARIRSNTNELVQVFNDKVSPVYDLPVLLIRDPNNPTRYKVDGRDVGRYENWGSSTTYLPRHGNTHSFNPDTGGGGDIVWVYGSQFMPLAVVPSGSYGASSVLLGRTSMYLNEAWRHIGGTGTSSLVTYNPTGSNARMVLVSINQYGNPILTPGSYFDATFTGTSQVLGYLPSTPANSIALAGVRLVSGTSVIIWDNIYDLRPFLVGSNGFSSAGHTIQDDGVSRTARSNLNFVGSSLTAYDDAGNDATVVSGSYAPSSFYEHGGADPLTSELIDKSTKILHYDVSEGVYIEYDATEASLATALASMGASDKLYLPNATFTGHFVLAANYIDIIGNGTYLQNDDINPILTISGSYSTLREMTIDFSDSSTGTLSAIDLSGGVFGYFYGVEVIAKNLNGNVYAVKLGSANLSSFDDSTFSAWDNNLGVYVDPFDKIINDKLYWDIDPVSVESRINFPVTKVRIHRSVANVSNPPTDAELDSTFGSPAEVGSGFTVLLDDGGGGTNEYLVISDGTSWWYQTLTKAI